MMGKNTSLFLHEHICLSYWKTYQILWFFFNNDKGTRHTKWTQLLSRMMIVFRNIFKSFVFLYKHIHMTWVTYIFFLYTSLFLHEHICLSSWKTSNTVKFFIIMPKTQGIQNKHNFISRMMIVFRNRFGKHSFFSTITYTLFIYWSGKLSIGQTLS